MKASNILLLSSILFLSGCAARQAPALEVDGPAFLLNHSLPDNVRLCVPMQTFRNEGVGCIRVGELRALLRSRVQS